MNEISIFFVGSDKMTTVQQKLKLCKAMIYIANTIGVYDEKGHALVFTF